MHDCLLHVSALRFWNFEQAWLSASARAGTKWVHTPQMSSVQPKAAVEFDQAINYVNKIKVCIAVHSQCLLSAAASNVKSRPVPALPIDSISGPSHCQSPAGLHLSSQAW